MWETGTAEQTSKPICVKVRKALATSRKFNCTLKCAFRSVVRCWPNEQAWEDEIEAKISRPCVMAFWFQSDQARYISQLAENFSPLQGSFPFFTPQHLATDSGSQGHHTWGQVMERCETCRVHWILLPFSLKITRSASNYEALYQCAVVEEGVRDILGFATSHENLIPLLDYFSARNTGLSAETLAGSVLPCTPQQAVEGGMCNMKEWPEYLTVEMQNPCINRYQTLTKLCLDESKRLPVPQLLPVPSFITPRLNLYGNEVSTSITHRNNKANAQRILKAHRMNHIRSVEAWSACEALERCVDTIPFPVVVKPIRGFGSEMVTLCYTASDVHNIFSLWEFQRPFKSACSGPLVVEEYIDGDEYVFNAVSFEGRHVVSDVWRSWKYPKKVLSMRFGPQIECEMRQMSFDNPDLCSPGKIYSSSLLYDRLEFVHDLASEPPEGDARRVVDFALRCLDKLGMRNGCSHCELRIDKRKGSASYGEPFLIELNPRMQGDVPRSTELVGYDQCSLLVYLSVAAAAFGATIKQTHQHPSDQEWVQKENSSTETRCLLPWPPAPKLYRSLDTCTVNPSERITRHVVFLCSNESGVIFDLAAAKLRNLVTFLREARGASFCVQERGVAVCVRQTVDLFSSPGACVLEGTEQDIRRDTEIIRKMEQATIPDSIRHLARRIIVNSRRVQAMNLKLSIEDGVKFSNTCEPREVSQSAALPLNGEGRVSPTLESAPKGQRSNYNCTPCACECLFLNLIHSFEQQYAEWMNSLQALEYPPLFISESDFELFEMIKTNWNSMIPYCSEQNIDLCSGC